MQNRGAADYLASLPRYQSSSLSFQAFGFAFGHACLSDLLMKKMQPTASPITNSLLRVEYTKYSITGMHGTVYSGADKSQSSFQHPSALLPPPTSAVRM